MAPKKKSRVATAIEDTTSLPLFESARQRGQKTHTGTTTQSSPVPYVVPTGLKTLDEELAGGFSSGVQHLAFGLLRAGSSSLVLGTALKTINSGHRVLVVSTAMDENRFRGRLVLMHGRINGFALRSGVLAESEKQKVEQARAAIPWRHLAFWQRPRILQEDIEALYYEYRPHLIVMDAPPKTVGRSEALTSQIAELDVLKRFAQEVNVPIIHHFALRGSYDLSRRLQLQDLPGQGLTSDSYGAILSVFRQPEMGLKVEQNANSPTGVQVSGEASRVEVSLLQHDTHRRLAPHPLEFTFDQRYAGISEQNYG